VDYGLRHCYGNTLTRIRSNATASLRMSDLNSLEAIAKNLRNAYRDGPMPPIREAVGGEEIEVAYRIQTMNTRYWIDSGRHIVGRKIGLTSPAVQKQLKIDQPDFGTLFSDMQIENGAKVPPGLLLQPKIEAEIAFVLERGLTATEPTTKDILDATAHVLPALEIVDSRIKGWDIGIVDTIADNASSGLFVLGNTPVDPRSLDLSVCSMVLEVDGRVVSRGVGAACLGNPLNAVQWLAKTLAKFGEPLRAGDVVLSGALGPMVSLNEVTLVSASISGVGAVRVGFAPPQV
jgi:2-keto-4-pentenoate hydratase